METKLLQKDLLKGTREFEIVDDSINVLIKPYFGKAETLTVMLSVLNPEPIINKSFLEFTSRVNNEALLSLFLSKPNTEEFNAFVSLLKKKIQDEFNVFAGLKSAAPSALEGNTYDNPPEFDTPDNTPAIRNQKAIKVEEIETSIRILSEQLDSDAIASFIPVLEAIVKDPQNRDLLVQMIEEFHKLGATQGAVLAYAPYINSLMSDDPFNK
jgi:hypothetical protein